MPKLSDQQIGQDLKSLPGWEYSDNSIHKLYRFKEFMDGIRFIGRVAEMAEAADHHPDIHVNYTRVTFICSTHSDGGVTEKDVRLSKQIEQAFTAQGG
ncbi:MAG TPA: 4a-hydroxytetrahydrobiopterin dehydratase [Candidatus Binataceae bacterium]|nr:4a-hydroxytetrahydrobiopterin dehydratase [Candidatus Binataceae bacterium]